jgi:lipopolysaccharide/colanic/teichoic acid biosynthesis glycosyltransferase
MRELSLESFSTTDLYASVVEDIQPVNEDELSYFEGLMSYCREADVDFSEYLLYYGKDSHSKSVLQNFNFTGIVSSELLNKQKFVNKYLEKMNEILDFGKELIVGAETSESLYRKNTNKYGKIAGTIANAFHYFLHRVCPKICLFKKLYYALNDTCFRSLSMVEILGRLVSCGFSLQSVTHKDGFDFFRVKKSESPSYDLSPSYSPVFSMKRVGQNGKKIYVYKFRTMHSYSEYLQAYIHKNNSLDKNGKFKYDYRVSYLGRLMRRYWIDELPMLINLIKGDIKLVGVRPVSEQYLGLYSHELKEKRFRNKPGLLPPYYADMPGSFQEVMESEMKYLTAYEKSHILTDVKYFFKIMFNIICCFKRSA